MSSSNTEIFSTSHIVFLSGFQNFRQDGNKLSENSHYFEHSNSLAVPLNAVSQLGVSLKAVLY